MESYELWWFTSEVASLREEAKDLGVTVEELRWEGDEVWIKVSGPDEACRELLERHGDYFEDGY